MVWNVDWHGVLSELGLSVKWSGVECRLGGVVLCVDWNVEWC